MLKKELKKYKRAYIVDAFKVEGEIISYGSVGKWARGEAVPRAKSLKILAKIFNINLEKLI